MLTNLEPFYDTRQSFYGKAKVLHDEDGSITLLSYNTKVCRIKGDTVELLPTWDYSLTTKRHVVEFLRQNHFKAESIQQIRKDYDKE